MPNRAGTPHAGVFGVGFGSFSRPPARPCSIRRQACLQHGARARRWCARAGALASTKRTGRQAWTRRGRRRGRLEWRCGSSVPIAGVGLRSASAIGCLQCVDLGNYFLLLTFYLLSKGSGYLLGKGCGYLLGKGGGRLGASFTAVGGGSGAGGASPRARRPANACARDGVCGVRGLLHGGGVRGLATG